MASLTSKTVSAKIKGAPSHYADGGGLDPLIEKKEPYTGLMDTVDHLFTDWHEGNIKRLKHSD